MKKFTVNLTKKEIDDLLLGLSALCSDYTYGDEESERNEERWNKLSAKLSKAKKEN